MNLYLRSFAYCHGLDDLLSGRYPHTHRFRKTIARLVVLTLTGAPKILQELFRTLIDNDDIALHSVVSSDLRRDREYAGRKRNGSGRRKSLRKLIKLAARLPLLCARRGRTS